MQIDKTVAFAVVIGTVIYFLFPDKSNWFAELCEKWVAVELLLRMIKKDCIRTR